MTETGLYPALPVNPLPYLTEWLFEIGPTIPAGMGAAPVGWDTISAWSDIMGVELLPWEARIIRALSREFLNEGHEAEDKDRPAPYTETIDRSAVSEKVRSLFRSRLSQEKD